MQIREQFLQPSLPQGFYWFNEPTHYRLGNGLEISTDEKTDFWQNTHYGFQRDEGHCLFMRQSGDFSIMTHVEFQPREKYDQCGLMVRIDAHNWIKITMEYESEHVSRLGSVVTNFGSVRSTASCRANSMASPSSASPPRTSRTTNTSCWAWNAERPAR